MAKQAFSSPQEVEQAEQEAQERREAEQEETEETREEQETTEEEEQQEAGEQTTEEEESAEEQEQEESEESDVSSELDEILSDHSEEPEIEAGEEEETEEPGEEETSEYGAMDLEIDNDRFEEITTDPESFQEFITEVREDAVKQARAEFQDELQKQTAQLREEILTNIPEVVQKTAQRAQSVNQVREQFFENNPALKNKMGYVRDMTNTVSHQNPDWSAKQVLDEVAKRAQRDLNLSAQAEEREKQRKSGPKFAGAGGRRKPGGSADNRGKQEKLMDDTFGKR